ncbi:unnamed protein product, partial [Allacma fusca]
RASNEFTPTMVAISVCASFALALLLIALIIWRRCFQGEYYYLDDPPRVPGHLNGLGWQGDSADELKQSLPAHLFLNHVQQLHVDGDIGFSKEYEAIQATCVQDEFPAEYSQHPENKQKNRYLNIVAYDHSRVRLAPVPGQKKSLEYVNANYIDGFRKAQAYIGTQGPLPSTFETFWRMVWEHNVHIIVMITNLVERGRAIESGETYVKRAYLSRYVHSLLSGSFNDDKSQVASLVEHQFKLVTQFAPKEFHLSAALKPFNLVKNRNLDNVSTDLFRVLLTPKPGVEGSDYINASFIPGFNKLQEFVITQHPMESTISEFWQMLWDHNIQTVVVVSAVDDGEYPTFWPTSGDDLDLHTNFRVTLLQESDRVGSVLRDFSMQSLQDDYELQIKIIQSSHWPHHSSNPLASVFDLIYLVQESLKESQAGPIAVVDRFGGLEAATFAALTTLYKQMVAEEHVDVYMIAKLYHEQRPGVWTNMVFMLYQFYDV